MISPWLKLNMDWRRIRLERIGLLTTFAAPRLRWAWDNTRKAIPLILIDARGRRWEFKLKAGAWIRPEPLKENPRR